MTANGVWSLAKTADTLQLANVLAEVCGLTDPVKIESHDRLHAAQGHVSALPIDDHGFNCFDHCEGSEEAILTLCHCFGLVCVVVAHAIIIASQAAYATPSGDESGNISDIS